MSVVANLCYRAENFLTAGEWEELRQVIVRAPEELTAATTTVFERPGGPPIHVAYRSGRSRVMFRLPVRSNRVFRKRLEQIWHSAAPSLGFPPIRLSLIEIQVASHTDSDHYAPHTDNKQWRHRRRIVSFAYYFHREPRSFAGGELALYRPGSATADVIEPTGNSIVLFASSTLHEVRTVTGPQDISEGRLAIVGWINR
jgi:Rps23 Pro-64 3,4-dihydroxylase Tpa1-like proline 4-hydroxylase